MAVRWRLPLSVAEGAQGAAGEPRPLKRQRRRRQLPAAAAAAASAEGRGGGRRLRLGGAAARPRLGLRFGFGGWLAVAVLEGLVYSACAIRRGHASVSTVASAASHSAVSMEASLGSAAELALSPKQALLASSAMVAVPSLCAAFNIEPPPPPLLPPPPPPPGAGYMEEVVAGGGVAAGSRSRRGNALSAASGSLAAPLHFKDDATPAANEAGAGAGAGAGGQKKVGMPGGRKQRKESKVPVVDEGFDREANAPSLGLRTGSKRKKVELVGYLGHGFFAEVWRAKLEPTEDARQSAEEQKDTRLKPGQELAVKFASVNKVQEYKLKREVKLMRRFSGGPFLQFFGAWTHRQFVCLAMELAEGDLKGMVIHKTFDQVKLPTRLILFHDLLEGGKAMADEGIIHRDLKPDNLMLVNFGTSRPSLKIGDFGVACQQRPSGLWPFGNMLCLRRQELNKAVGGIPYMSPEFIAKKFTPGGDAFAAGIILYQLIFQGMFPIGYYVSKSISANSDELMSMYQKMDIHEDSLLIGTKAYAASRGDVVLYNLMLLVEGLCEPQLEKRLTMGQAMHFYSTLPFEGWNVQLSQHIILRERRKAFSFCRDKL